MRAEKFDFRNKEGQQLAALRDRPDWPITFEGALDAAPRARASWKLPTNARLEIVDKCPVHRTLKSEVDICAAEATG